MRSLPAIVSLLLGVCSHTAEAESVHWHQFRGPNGAGTAARFKPPLNIVAQQAAWRTPLPPGKSSPVLWGERIYVTGEVVYRERVGAAGQYSASPVIADGHLVLVSSQGVLTVVKCGDEFTITHQTDLAAPIAATPAMDRNSIYIRADDALMAFR